MTRRLIVFLVCGFLTAVYAVELSAQTPSATTMSESSTRRSSLFGASRGGLFISDGERGSDSDRATLKEKSLEREDRMMTMLGEYDPSRMLDDPAVRNTNLFLIGGAMQSALNLTQDATAAAGEGEGGLAIGEIDTSVAATAATSTVRATGMYAPRLRFVYDEAELKAMQTPEAQAELEQADLKRIAKLLADISDKFDLPPSANISLEFHGLTARIQGRVPSPILRKQVGLYLGFEPGIYSMQNDLVVDPSVADEPRSTEPASPTRNDPES